MNRSERPHAIVEELRAVSPRPRSAAWLARQFEISTRTVERDLTALRESGVAIRGVGRTGGYFLDRHRTLPPVTLTATEALAISVRCGPPATPPSPPTHGSPHRKFWRVTLPDGSRKTGVDVNVLRGNRVRENWTFVGPGHTTHRDPIVDTTTGRVALMYSTSDGVGGVALLSGGTEPIRTITGSRSFRS